MVAGHLGGGLPTRYTECNSGLGRASTLKRRDGGIIFLRAIEFKRFGGPEELALVELPDPAPDFGEMLVEVRAASVIPGDWKLRRGLLADIFPVRPPKVPGRDGAGIVRAVGAGVDDFAPGDRVCFTCEHVEQGSYAELCVRPAGAVVKLPDELGFAEGAALMHAGVCAYIAVVETARLQSGESILIHGAGGAIGGMAVQIARHLGAHVTATASARNREHVLGLGAERSIAYDQEDFSRVVRDQDIVLDLVGGTMHDRSFAVLRPGGRLVWLIAEPFGPPPEGFDGQVLQAEIHDRRPVLKAVVGLAAEGAIRPLVSRTMPLDRAAEAHDILETGRNSRGRIILEPRPRDAQPAEQGESI